MIDEELVGDKGRATSIIKQLVITHEELMDNYLKLVEAINCKEKEVEEMRTSAMNSNKL